MYCIEHLSRDHFGRTNLALTYLCNGHRLVVRNHGRHVQVARQIREDAASHNIIPRPERA